MKSLRLNHCITTSHQLKAFVNRLEDSQLASLELNDYFSEDIEGVECLLRALPRTSIKHLKLTGIPLKSIAAWSGIAPLFETCQLETLTLAADSFPFRIVHRLATAIRNNHTICELHLYECKIGIPNLRLLIDSMTHGSRRAQRKRVKWTIPYGHDIEPSIENSLVAIAKVCGGEFLKLYWSE
ncbi:unnamed protein product [Aphanomyces euteiches]